MNAQELVPGTTKCFFLSRFKYSLKNLLLVTFGTFASFIYNLWVCRLLRSMHWTGPDPIEKLPEPQYSRVQQKTETQSHIAGHYLVKYHPARLTQTALGSAESAFVDLYARASDCKLFRYIYIYLFTSCSCEQFSLFILHLYHNPRLLSTFVSSVGCFW